MRLTKYWFLEDSFNMMKRLGMRNMMNLCDLLEMKSYKKGQEIQKTFETNDLIYFIKKGHVKIGKIVDGEFSLVDMLGKGNIFGESKIVMGEESEEFLAIAASNCVICFIETDLMEELMEQYPKLHSSILKIAGAKFKRIERRLDDILYKDAESRIWDFIVDFVDENSEEEGVRKAKNIFSHKEIAKLTSTSRQTVNNVISKLRQQKMLEYNSHEIIIK